MLKVMNMETVRGQGVPLLWLLPWVVCPVTSQFVYDASRRGRRKRHYKKQREKKRNGEGCRGVDNGSDDWRVYKSSSNFTIHTSRHMATTHFFHTYIKWCQVLRGSMCIPTPGLRAKCANRYTTNLSFYPSPPHSQNIMEIGQSNGYTDCLKRMPFKES